MTFEEWEECLDVECLARTFCTWADLCGDEEPIREAYEAGTSVEDFVTYIVQKYRLVEGKNFV